MPEPAFTIPCSSPCSICGREFESARRFAVTCDECDAREHAEYIETYKPLDAPSYDFQRFRRGRYRD